MTSVVALALCAACTPATDQGAAELDEEQRIVDYRLSVRGAVNATIERDAMPLMFRRLLDPRVELRFFGIENVAWMPVDGGELVAGLALIGYHGDGEYRLREIDPNAPQGDLSNAWLDVRAGTSPALQQFRSHRCAVVISQDGAAGEMSCSRLQDVQGKKVSLDLSWSPATG